MSLTLQPYDAAWADRWDTFVAASRNGTLFHTQRFLSYHPKGRFDDASLLFLEDGVLRGVLPAALRREGDRTILASHPGASYGGLVTRPDTSVQETGAMIAALRSHAEGLGYEGIAILRLPPASLHRAYAEDVPHWLYRDGYALTRCEMDGAVDLRGKNEEMILPSLPGKCRNMIRQAQRSGLRVRLSEEIETFWPILEGVLRERHGATPTHTLEEMRRLRGLLPEHVRLLAAEKDGRMVGGIILVTVHPGALYTLYMAQEYAAQRDHPMHLLLFEAMLLALREGRGVLHLGVSTEDGGRVLNEGLVFFKESFGCRPVRRETWERRIDRR